MTANSQVLDHDQADSRILVVETGEPTGRVIEPYLHEAGYHNILTVDDLGRVLSLFTTWRPDIVLMDLPEEQADSYTILEQLIAWIGDKVHLPVVVLTSDRTPETMHKALDIGATDFVTKPLDPVELGLRIRTHIEGRLLYLQLQLHQSRLEDLVATRTQQLDDAQKDIADRLALAAEFRDDITGLHTQRVGLLSAAIAGDLDLAPNQVELIRLAAPLHDIGKIGIPDSILLKPARLTDIEFRRMQEHTTAGARILAGSLSPILQMGEIVALAHHEHWDGGGYVGIAGPAIPLVARIVTVADVYDALSHKRPYKEAWTTEDTIAEMESLNERHFDPMVLASLIHLHNAGEISPDWTRSA